MSRCIDENTLVEMLGGEISTHARAEIERHLDGCPDCRRLVAEAAREDVPRDDTVPGTTVEPERQLKRGESVGRFVILHPVGAGGMGVVYAAYDPNLDRKVALKLLHPGANAELRIRLLREAQSMARLSHPNVVPVYEVGSFDEQVFLAMEFVEGQNLSAWLKADLRSWREILRIFVQAGRGLAAAHSAGIVHRDFKPDNVLVRSDGRVQVTDFGLARSAGLDQVSLEDSILAEARDASADAVTPSSVGGSPTRTGALVGTPAYMAPEQIEGRPADERSDLFSFCVAFYEALCRERPFAADSWEETRAAVLAGRVSEPARGARVPGWLRRAVLRGLQRAPEDRYPSMSALLVELGRDPGRSRRRVALAVSIVGLAGAVLGLALYRGADRGEICAGALKKLTGAWDAGVRAKAAAAFRRTQRPYAGDAWRETSRVLDDYARGWVRMSKEACEATRIRGEQSASLLDLRMACLQQRLAGLRATTALLVEADAKTVARSTKMAYGLRSLQGCADAKALRAAVRPPSSVQARSRVEAVRGQLARVHALIRAARYRDALNLARQARTVAETLGYLPLLAEVAYAQAIAEKSLGRSAAAERTLRAGYFFALRTGHDSVALDASVELADLVANVRGRAKAGEEWVRHAESWIARTGNDSLLRADLLAIRGQIATTQARHREALRLARLALKLKRGRLGPDHPLLARPHSTLAMVHFDLGRYPEALGHARKALELNERRRGKWHPTLATNLQNIGAALVTAYSFDEAVGYLNRALWIRGRVFGKEHRSVWGLLSILGVVHTYRGEFGRARVVLERALSAVKKALGSDHFRVAMPLHNLGDLYQKQGRYQEALVAFQRAMALTSSKLGSEHPAVALHLTGIGLVRMGQGNLQEAERVLRRALDIRKKRLGSRHPDVATANNLMGSLRLRQARAPEALRFFEQALSIQDKALPGWHPDRAEPLTGVAEVHLAQGNAARAIPLLRRAHRLQQERGGDPQAVAATRFALARALWATGGRRGRARRLASEAAAGFAKFPYHRRWYRRVRAWLAGGPRAPRKP